MNFRASYSIVQVTKEIVFIVDNNDGSKSITNDAEHVCATINKSFPGKRIIYRDTMQRWDELVHINGRFVRFEANPMVEV